MIQVLSVHHAPTYYDAISDYKFLYKNSGVYFIVKYHYYNGLVSFSTLPIPDWSVDTALTFEKQNEQPYGKEIVIQDDYCSVLHYLPVVEREAAAALRNQRDEKVIPLLLKAYELSRGWLCNALPVSPAVDV